MREFSMIPCTLWTGVLGRSLKKQGVGPYFVALYLLSCPSNNGLGLFHLALPTAAHETGLTEDQFKAALRKLSEIGFAFYDEAQELIWIPEGANLQTGPSLKPTDNQIRFIKRVLGTFPGKFHDEFLKKYGAAYHLDETPSEGGTGPPLKQYNRTEQTENENKNRTAVTSKCELCDGTGKVLVVLDSNGGVSSKAPFNEFRQSYFSKQGKTEIRPCGCPKGNTNSQIGGQASNA